jgi:MSHA pilin protein MshC
VPAGFRLHRPAGFTIVELITIMIVIGIIGAIGAARFADDSAFQNRAYADQVKSLIRYAQKLAISQNRRIFVRANGNSFAICSAANCAAGTTIPAPGGSNSGTAATRNACVQAGAYLANWACEGRPANVALNSGGRAEVGPGGSFSFDPLGRPYNLADTITSTFANLTLTFTSGGNTATMVISQETGYVQ